MTGKVIRELEAWTRAADDGERHEVIKAIRAHFAPEPANMDGAAMTDAAMFLETDPGEAERIIRAHFGPPEPKRLAPFAVRCAGPGAGTVARGWRPAGRGAVGGRGRDPFGRGKRGKIDRDPTDCASRGDGADRRRLLRGSVRLAGAPRPGGVRELRRFRRSHRASAVGAVWPGPRPGADSALAGPWPAVRRIRGRARARPPALIGRRYGLQCGR